MVQDLKGYLNRLLPKSFQLPIRYCYQRLKGTVDDELFRLDELVGSGKRAIDIGANYGIYTYLLSRLCEKVEAFEPQSECAETISAYSRYLAKKNKNNINVHGVGLSDTCGWLTLHVPVKNDKRLPGYATFNDLEGSHESIKVPIRRLDDFNFRDVSFIKIDVEGYETRVINGGRETILREKPVMLVEIEQRHLVNKPIADVFNLIINLGYKGEFLYRKKLIPLDEFSYEHHQKPFLNKTQSRDYINNFIFQPMRS